MVVDLSPVDELDVDEDILSFVREAYCANCTHFTRHGEDDIPYCTHWEERTEIKRDWVCTEYLPQGFEER